MTGPQDKELLRVQDQERVDTPDFQHLQRQVLYWHESIAALLSSESLIRGFELSVVSPTSVRVTPNTAGENGVIIVPEFGGDNSTAPRDGGTSYSAVVDLNSTAKDKSLSTYATGQFLHVYAAAVWNATKLDQRAFWVPPAGPEAVNSINTRFVLEWQLTIVAHHQPPPARSVRIGTIWWSGSLTAPDLYQSAQMLFEGSAVEGGSAVEVPSGGTPPFAGFWQDNDGTIPDFDRSDNRWANGSKSFAEFARMVLRETQEIKSQSRVLTPKHWEKPPYGLSLRAAQGSTFTIGEGTKLSEGNQNGIADALNPGYRNIGPALTFLIAAAVTEGMTDVCIKLKPGRYSVTSVITIPGTMRFELHGCGPLATELKITDNGKIRVETDASTEASAGLSICGMSLWGTTGDNMLEVQSSNIGNETTYRFSDLMVVHTAGAAWLRQTQEGRGTRLHIHNVRSDDDSIIRFLSCAEIVASHSTLGHIYFENTTGTIEKQALVYGSHINSFRCDTEIGDILFNGCTIHHINVCESAVLSIVGSSFILNGTLEDALGVVDTSLLATNITGVSIAASIFRSSDSVTNCVACFDACGRVGISTSAFIAVLPTATAVPTYGIRAINMPDIPTLGERASIRNCFLSSPGETWIDGFSVEECRFTSESATLGQTTMIANCPEVYNTTIEIVAGTPNKLMDGVGHIHRCHITANQIASGQGEIIPIDDLDMFETEIQLLSGGMTVQAENILLRNVNILGSQPNKVILISTQDERRVVCESVFSEIEVMVQSSSGIHITLDVVDSDFYRIETNAHAEHVRLTNSTFETGGYIYLIGPGMVSSVEAVGCSFYGKRFWSSGVAGKLGDPTYALSGPGLYILSVEDDGIAKVVVDGCEFWQLMNATVVNPAVMVRARYGVETVVRNNFLAAQFPSVNWASSIGVVSLTYANRVQVESNIFMCFGDSLARPGPMVDVQDAVGLLTNVTRWCVGFDDNQVQFAEPTSSMKFDLTYGRIVHLGDISGVVKAQASFCRNKIDARWSNPSPRVFWTDNSGIISAAKAIGVAYQNLIVDDGGVVSSFNATSPNGNISTIFAGAYGDNFFA
jgi:hypothetical protein